MNLSGALCFELVYTCSGEEEHEVRERVRTLEEIDEYSYEDADPCTTCRVDYKEYSNVTLDRVEVVNPMSE